jgi:hypothetical protein
MTIVIRLLRRTAFAILGGIYSVLYKFGEIFESRFEIYLGFGELILVLFGLVAATADVRGRLLGMPAISDPAERFHAWLDILGEHWRDPFEALIFLVLALLTSSRVLTALRRRYLGYYFASSLHSDQLFMKIIATDFGSPPLSQKNTPTLRLGFAEAIAGQTAALLSLRSFLGRDVRWVQRERDHLDRWFRDCPNSLWRVPLTGQERQTTYSGYFSVIIPISDKSWSDIRSATVPTDVADIDHKALVSESEEGLDKRQLKFLAYLQVFCADQHESGLDKDLLAATSFQHLAHLLFLRYGAAGDFWRNWQFAIMCESANRTMDKFLTGLGFGPVQRPVIESSRASTLPARSWADFKLFEFKASQGEASDVGDRVDAGHFLELLQDLVKRYATHQPGSVA